MEPALRVAGGIDTHEESDMPRCPYDSVHLGFNAHRGVCVSHIAIQTRNELEVHFPPLFKRTSKSFAYS